MSRRVALLVAAAGVLLVAGFDVLGPALAFNDDWGMAWSVRHFPRIYPAQSALALPQDAWALLVVAGHGDPRLLRLSAAAFLVLLLWATQRLAGLAGASPSWGALAAAAPLANPVLTGDATTFMTDVPYTALLLAATLACARWESGSLRLAGCVALVTAAALQRQVGVALAVALAVDLAWRRHRPAAVLVAAAPVAAVALVAMAGLAPPTQANRASAVFEVSPVIRLLDVLFLPGQVGLALVAFVPGLLLAGRERASGRDYRPVALVLIGGALASVIALNRLNVFPAFAGDVFTPYGLNYTWLWPDKPHIYPGAVFVPLEALAVAGVLLLAWRWTGWGGSPMTRILLLVSVSQFIPLLLVAYIAFDRYYLPVVAPLVPLAAAAAARARRPELALSTGLGVVVGGLLLYAAGEQDYQAWQVARDAAARLAYAQAPPLLVNAGYEANAVYVEVPTYERTGALLTGAARPGAYDFSVDGPERPVLVLRFAPFDDRRPGVSYISLAPGRIVLAAPAH